MKTCKKCGNLKHLNDFHKQKAGKLGRRSRCKECLKETNFEYFKVNKGELNRRRQARLKDPIQRTQSARLKWVLESKGIAS